MKKKTFQWKKTTTKTSTKGLLLYGWEGKEHSI